MFLSLKQTPTVTFVSKENTACHCYRSFFFGGERDKNQKKEHEIVLYPVKELYFLTGWIVIMTVLLNRLMQRAVLLKAHVPSL